MAFFSIASELEGASPVHDRPETHKVLVVGGGSTLVVATVAESSSLSVAGLTVTGDPSSIVCASVSPSNLQVAACTDNKTLVVWRREGGVATWVEVGRRVLPKRAMVLHFTGDHKVLVGDKTGEVKGYPLGDWTAAAGEHLLGHFSMLLDMVISPGNDHVITCDRDEKIRVSKFPNSYSIESFCLGHTGFVSSICICPKLPHLLISGSGDGTVKVWEWFSGRLLCSEQVGEVPPDGGDGGVTDAVTKVTCSRTDPPMVVAASENSSQLAVFSVSADGALSLRHRVQLPTVPRDATFDWSDNLWVCLKSHSPPIVAYKCKEGSLLLEMVLSSCENPLLESLNKWEYCSKELEACSRDWDQLRKHTFDNMESYMWRKEARLKKAKLSSVKDPAEEKSPPQTPAEDSTVTSTPPQEEEGLPPSPQEEEGSPAEAIEGPPLKKTKLENNHDF